MAIELRTGGDGKPRYLVRIEGTDPVSGKRKRTRVGSFTNRKVAEKAELAALLQRDSGTLLDPKTTTVAEWLDEFLLKKAGEVSSNSLNGYQIDVRVYLKPAFGATKLQKLNAAVIQAQIRKWLVADVPPNRVRRLLTLLKAAFDHAVRLQMINFNPARSVTPPRKTRAKINYWNGGEARAFLKAVQDFHAHWTKLTPGRFLLPSLLWDLALREGMRRGEVLGLRWSDVNWDTRTAHISQTVIPDQANKGAALIQDRTKTKTSARSVRLSDETVDALRARQQEWRLQRMRSDRWQDTDLIVCSEHGGPINPGGIDRAMNGIIKMAKYDDKPLRRITFHDLRHTCATLLFSAGVPAKVVQEKLGHASISETLDTYSHVLPNMQDDAAAAMSKLLSISAVETTQADLARDEKITRVPRSG